MDDAQIEVLVEANNAAGVDVPLSILLLLARVDQLKKDLKMMSDVVTENYPWIKPGEFKEGLFALKLAELDEVVERLTRKYVQMYEQWVEIYEVLDADLPSYRRLVGQEDRKDRKDRKDEKTKRTEGTQGTAATEVVEGYYSKGGVS